MNVDLKQYKLLNNPNKISRIPRLYSNCVIKTVKNKIAYFYCLNEFYDEVQNFFNLTLLERQSISVKNHYENMSDEEMEIFKKKTSDGTKLGISKMSDFDKQKLNLKKSENHKKYWQSVDHKEIGKLISKGRDNMSDEDKQKMKEHISETKLNFSQEKKDEISDKISRGRKEYFKNITDEEKFEYSESRKRTWENKSEEEKQRLSDLQKEIWNNKSDEEKVRLLELQRNSISDKSDEWKKSRYENLKKSNLEKYGVENQYQRQEIVEKIKETKIEKYNSLSLGVKANYRYNDIKFDSSYELYYYIYNHDILKNDIARGKRFEYFVNEKSHIYECDFLVNGQNVEIKGNHLINEKMELINYRTKEVLKEKTECMRKNNVKIILTVSLEMDKIVKIVEDKYPKLVFNSKVVL